MVVDPNAFPWLNFLAINFILMTVMQGIKQVVELFPQAWANPASKAHDVILRTILGVLALALVFGYALVTHHLTMDNALNLAAIVCELWAGTTGAYALVKTVGPNVAAALQPIVVQKSSTQDMPVAVASSYPNWPPTVAPTTTSAAPADVTLTSTTASPVASTDTPTDTTGATA